MGWFRNAGLAVALLAAAWQLSWRWRSGSDASNAVNVLRLTEDLQGQDLEKILKAATSIAFIATAPTLRLQLERPGKLHGYPLRHSVQSSERSCQHGHLRRSEAWIT